MARLNNQEREFIVAQFTTMKTTAESHVSEAANLTEIKTLINTIDQMDAIIDKLAPAPTPADV